ncbi:MAG: hypothetical protein Q8L44_00085, partial [Sulfuritalea sp.]|nr:hypothetical protein [Sulfuritalea sp.]
MNFINKNLGFGLGWVILVGGGASFASGGGLGLSTWIALLLVGIGWQAIAALAGNGAAKRAAEEQRMRDEEQALLVEFRRLL